MTVVMSRPAAAAMTAAQLHDICTSPYDVDVGLCAGYVAAVAEKILSDYNPARQTCLNPGIAPEVLVANIQREWALAPPMAEDQAFQAVEGALRSRFRYQ